VTSIVVLNELGRHRGSSFKNTVEVLDRIHNALFSLAATSFKSINEVLELPGERRAVRREIRVERAIVPGTGIRTE
jgi:hypothetical protein